MSSFTRAKSLVMEESLNHEENYKAIIRELKEKSEQLREKNRAISLKLQQTQEELNNMLAKLNPAERQRM